MTAGTWNENKDFIHVVLLLNYVDKQWSWCSQLPAGHAGVGIHKRTKFPNRKANVQLWWNLTKSSEQVSGQNSISVVDELDPGHDLFLYLLDSIWSNASYFQTLFLLKTSISSMPNPAQLRLDILVNTRPLFKQQGTSREHSPGCFWSLKLPPLHPAHGITCPWGRQVRRGEICGLVG